MSAMANVYVSLIEKGKKTIDQVPASVREEVQSILDSNKVEE